ncbi:MAG TPA: hypothetical protein VKY31_00345 [Terriglobia bacterium]|nr:hypothetical protein [Terriglobia bacterium]
MTTTSLHVTAFERLMLPSGRIVDVPKATPSFPVWHGEQPTDRYGKKPLVNFEGRMAFAELAILWSLQQSGWNGVWVDTYRRKFRTDYWNSPSTELPEEPRALLDRISAVRGGKQQGTWDIFCWRDDEYLFAESKWKTHDRLKPAQLEWLDAALSLDLPLPSFLIVEWSLHTQHAWVS